MIARSPMKILLVVSARKKVGMYYVIAGSLLMGVVNEKYTLIYFQVLMISGHDAGSLFN